MKDPTVSFFKTAKQCSLSKEETMLIAEKIGIRVREKHVKRPLGMTSTVFLKKMKAVSLSPSERAVIREWLMDAMQKKRQQHWWLYPLKHMTSITAGILIVTITSGSLSYAAENAVPGDVLYPVKVSVNEPVRDVLMTSPESQATWEAEKAERRLKEAEIINSRAEMTAEKQAQIQDRFRRHARMLRTRMANVPAPVAIDIAQRFEARLRAHGNALEKMNSTHPERASRLQNLLADVMDERMKVEEHLASTTAENDDMPSIDDMMEQRRKIRRNAEDDVFAKLPVANDDVRLIDQAPPSAMMMKQEAPMMMQRATPPIDDMRDMALSIEARMRATKERLDAVREQMHRENHPMQNDIEVRMMGAEQILSVAESQMEAGNVDDALRASDMALRHAEKARKEGEKRQRGVDAEN